MQIFDVIIFFKLRTIQQKTVKPTYLCPLGVGKGHETASMQMYTELRKTVLLMPMKKMSQERLQAVETVLFQWKDVWRIGWFPYHCLTRSGRIRRKGPDNEAWSFSQANSIVSCRG